MSGHRFATALIVVSITATLGAQKAKKGEAFIANAQVVASGAATAGATVDINIDRYMTESEQKPAVTTLEQGGQAAFIKALNASPALGTVEMAGVKETIHWASDRKVGDKREIIIVVPKPLAFIGGARPGAKPREGFDVAFIKLVVDAIGLGDGQMVAAAKVKKDPNAGVQIDDYSEQPIKLATVRRKMQ